MPSDKKLTHLRSDHFKGPKRTKPKVRELNKAIVRRVMGEHDLVQAILRDAELRRQLFTFPGVQLAPFVVYQDFAHSEDYTEIDPTRLPEWKDIGEYAKLHLLLMLGLEIGGYSFTANVRPDLESQWVRKGINPVDRIKRLVNAEMKAQGLEHVEYFYVVEGKAKDGARYTRLHIHGVFLAAEPIVATRVKTVLERAIGIPPTQKLSTMTRVKWGNQVPSPEPLYDAHDGKGGHNRWVRYLTKNATKTDRRLGARRIHISQSATQAAKAMWSLLRDKD